MAFGAVPEFNYKNISATTTLKASPGVLAGILVSSVSGSPSVTVYNTTTGTGTKIVDTFVPVAGQWYPMPAGFDVGLTVAIAATCSVTVFWT